MRGEELRRSVLVSFGANHSEVEELIAYNQNVFDHTGISLRLGFPLPDEPFVAAWEHYVDEVDGKGFFEYLKGRLVQLSFPIHEGISRTEDYRAATRRGVSTDGMSQATGLALKHPEKFEFVLYQSMAGRIPILITNEREDFVSLVQALVKRNEPGNVPASMGACMVAGYNNWDRIRQYREKWARESPSCCSEDDWEKEFQKIIPRKELFQDRFMILSDGPYSGVSAGEMQIPVEKWKSMSLVIRREHECAHYFTKRVFSSMRNNIMDEMIADYTGITASAGSFRADWFLRFVGLESFPDYRARGRLENYRGSPALSDGAFKVLQILVRSAAENLETFDSGHSELLHTAEGKVRMLMGLTCLTLEELASKEASAFLQQSLDKVAEQFQL